jgi:hypothetical protein
MVLTNGHEWCIPLTVTDDRANEAVVAMRLRIKAVDAEMAELGRQKEAIEAQSNRLWYVRNALQEAIDQEESLLKPLDPTSIPELHPGADNLSDLLLATLKRSGPLKLEQLKKLAVRWAPLQDSNFPGRALNFALVGLQKGGHVDRQKDGSWVLTESGENRK